MRIPPSVIVMSLLTAVPFGLGIRDTLKAKDAHASDDYSDLDGDYGGDSADRKRALEEYEAELKREAVEREARAAERITKLDQLFGTNVATMGSLLDGIRLGAGAGSFQPEDVRRRIERETRDGFLSVTFDADADTLNAVNVVVNTDYETGEACDKLERKLEKAWGSSPTNAWLDSATKQRATFDEDACMLRFDRYVEPAEWVAALPFAAVGGNAEKFADTLGQSAEVDDERIYWRVPGLRFGKRDTQIEAYVVNNKIVGFKATVDSDFDSTVAVRDALSTKLKAQPKKDEYDNIWDWKRRVPVTLDQFDTDRFSVLVGKMPWDY